MCRTVNQRSSVFSIDSINFLLKLAQLLNLWLWQQTRKRISISKTSIFFSEKKYRQRLQLDLSMGSIKKRSFSACVIPEDVNFCNRVTVQKKVEQFGSKCRPDRYKSDRVSANNCFEIPPSSGNWTVYIGRHAVRIRSAKTRIDKLVSLYNSSPASKPWVLWSSVCLNNHFVLLVYWA